MATYERLLFETPHDRSSSRDSIGDASFDYQSNRKANRASPTRRAMSRMSPFPQDADPDFNSFLKRNIKPSSVPHRNRREAETDKVSLWLPDADSGGGGNRPGRAVTAISNQKRPHRKHTNEFYKSNTHYSRESEQPRSTSDLGLASIANSNISDEPLRGSSEFVSPGTIIGDLYDSDDSDDFNFARRMTRSRNAIHNKSDIRTSKLMLLKNKDRGSKRALSANSALASARKVTAANVYSSTSVTRGDVVQKKTPGGWTGDFNNDNTDPKTDRTSSLSSVFVNKHENKIELPKNRSNTSTAVMRENKERNVFLQGSSLHHNTHKKYTRDRDRPRITPNSEIEYKFQQDNETDSKLMDYYKANPDERPIRPSNNFSEREVPSGDGRANIPQLSPDERPLRPMKNYNAYLTEYDPDAPPYNKNTSSTYNTRADSKSKVKPGNVSRKNITNEHNRFSEASSNKSKNVSINRSKHTFDDLSNVLS